MVDNRENRIQNTTPLQRIRQRLRTGFRSWRKSAHRLAAGLLGLGILAMGSVQADPFPPTLANGAAHFAPVAWPHEPADIKTCGFSCGDWKPYTRFQAGITDPRTQDPSNGGTAPQNYVNISSSCVDKAYPSVYYNLYKHPTDAAQDVLFFRWRVEQIANNYATGPSAGNFSTSDPWSSALWTVLFDIDGSGYRSLAAHLNGSSGSPSASIDMLAGIWGNIPTQSIDYLNDPNIKLIAHNPTAFTSGSQILNYHNSLSPDTNWPAGSTVSGTTYDYGTTRSRVVTSSPCNEYFVDYQIPIRMLDASSSGPNASLNGPKITRSTPISMLFCTANSLNNPFQKDCALNRGWIADASKPAPFGDYISFDQTAPYSQPIVSSVTASPPNTCPGAYTLQAKVQDTLYVDASGNVKPSVKQVQFFYWLDADGDGTTAGDTGSAWTLAATATLKPGSLNLWTASWDATGLPKGKYLIGVQAVDDKTLHDDGVADSPVENRTFSYLVGSVNTATQGQIYINPWSFDGTTQTWTSGGSGAWVDTQQASFQAHAAAMTPGTTENWYGNPAVTGVQTALIGLAVNACGVAPTITKTASASSVATGQAVTYTVTVANATGGSIKLTQLDDPLPSGFTYASTTSVTNNGTTVTPTSVPTGGSSGTVSWVFNNGSGIDIANNNSVVLTFVTTASSTAGTYNNTATATTSLGAVTSPAVAVGVDAARISLSKTPNTYSVNPGGSVTYTLAYSNDSSVPVTSATLTDTLPTNVACTSYAINGGASVACSGTSVSIPLGTLAAGASGSVALTVAVSAGYNSASLLNTATLDVLAPDGVTHVTRSASSTIAVNVPVPAFTLTKTASAVQVAPGGSITWTISYKNYGTGAASGVTITDVLPGGFTYASSSNSGAYSNGQVSWNIGNVAAGASGSVTVTGTLGTSGQAFSYANPTTNRATVTWSLNATGVSATSEVGVTGQACSAVYYFKTDLSTSTTAPLQSSTGTSTVLNTGSSPTVVFTSPATTTQTVLNGKQLSVTFYIDPAVGNLTLTAQVDRILTNNSVSNITTYPQTGLPNTAGWYSFNFSFTAGATDLLVGEKLKFTFTVSNGTNKNLTLYYDGYISAKSVLADSHASICSASSPASLSLAKTVDAASIASASGTLNYVLSYANVGGADATSVSLADTLPAGLTCSRYTNTCTDWTNVPSTCSSWTSCSGSSLTLTPGSGTVTAGSAGKYLVQATVGASASGTLTNSATLSGSGLASSTATANTVVGTVGGGGSPALVLSKSANKTLLVAGDTVTYTLTLVNTGGGSASTVVVTDDFPDQTWFVYGSCTTATGTCQETPTGTLRWDVSTLSAGSSATLTFTMTVGASGVPVGANTLNNTATVSDSSYCTSAAVAGCSSNTVTVTVSGNPNLSMTKSSSPATLAPGGVVTYSMVVTNSGSGAASGVVVSDPVPSNTVFKAITLPGPGTANFDAVGNRAVFNIGTLASGASATVAFTATVNSLPSGSTTITNTASTTATNSPQRSASASSTASAAPVMTLQKNGPSSVAFPATTLSASATASTNLFVASSALLSVGDRIQIANGTDNPIVTVTAIAGNVITVSAAVTATSGSAVRRGAVWALTYQNTGTADASSVVVSDPLPANWVYAASSPTASSAPAVGSNGTVTWNIGTVAAGTSGTVQVLAIPTASGSVTNTASLSASGLGTVSSSLATAAGGLTVTKSTNTAVVSAGGVAHYTVTVSNTLGSAVNGVTVTDLLPSGFTYKAASASLVYTGGGSNGAVEPTLFNGDSAQPQWTGLSIAANGSVAIDFDANVSATVGPATYQNGAELSGVPAGVGVTPFDPLSTTAEDVTVLASGTGVVDGYVFKDLNGNGVFDAGTDLPLTGVRVSITDSGNTTYTVATDSSGYFSRVVPSGSTSVDVVNADVPSGLSLATGNTDPATVTVPSGGSVRKNTGYAVTGTTPDMSVSLSGLPTTAQVGVAYTGSFTCSNVGSADAVSGTTCSVSGLPSGLTVTGCTINTTPSVAWTAGNAVPVGKVVTCTVSGTPTATGTSSVSGSTGATGDTNLNNDSATTSIAVSAAATAPDLRVSLAGLPTTGQVGTAYSGTFTCTNIGTADATAGTTCTVTGLPSGVTVGSCSINTTPSVSWSGGDSVPVGKVVTCTVSGTPTASGSSTVDGATSATGDSNSSNNTASTTVAISAAATSPDMKVLLTGLSTSALVGAPYSSTYTCTNIGSADATAGTSCSVSGLPAGLTVTGCVINTTPATSWTTGSTVTVGQVVTCTVAGTPTTAGTTSVNGSTGATGDVNVPNNTASVNLVVNPSFAPLAANDSAVTNYNTAVTITASANDSAGPGTTLALNTIDLDPTTAGRQTSRTIDGEGSFVANNDGSVTFTPVSGFEGVATVPYTIQNALGLTSNVANITVTVRPATGSAIPAAQNDFGTTTPVTPVTLSVLTNDQASAGKTLVANSIALSGANAAQGTWVANPGGTVTFTPANGFVGTATVNYTVQDTGGGTSNTATITVTVAGGTLPAAQNDSASTKPLTAVTIPILTNDAPGDGHVLSPGTIALGGTTPSNGTWVVNASGTVTFTPANGFTGTATATYTVQDSAGGTSNTATITVTVNPVAPAATNDTAPSGIRTLNPANNDTASAGATLNPSTIDLDPTTPGIQRSFTVAGQGTWEVVDNSGTVRFTPVAGFYGTAQLNYAISDSLGNTATAIMAVPIDPSGVVYDSSTRAPIAGATVTLLYNGGSANAYVTGGNATLSTNASGQYAFFLIGGAPAGTYSLTVSKSGYVFQSTVIPPAAGSWPAGGGAITAIAGAPAVGQPTLYYLSGPAPTSDVTNNNIPLDPVAVPAVSPVPTLSQWALLVMAALVLLQGLVALPRLKG
jgi:uncharacterized repeat protein (TIGR01451 family)/fimbrial isopeptide formation D2 family protein